MADNLNGRLLDVHTVYNIAFALTEFRSEEFFDTIRSVWKITDQRIKVLPPQVPVVFTEALAGESDWAKECWSRVERIAAERGPLFVVHIVCSLNENRWRIQSPDRDLKRKPRDASYAEKKHAAGEQLLGSDSLNLLQLDATDLSADEAALSISNWIAEHRSERGL
ncbi:hypothetical protein [Pelagibius sp. Alg239-R121]|uniref:hypothetical protein n=1 Tax=Pelagibius sp. Alg239-R121 TaxID=2993448 RepID=UPI0024A7992D|nr:hypothetical protein [Pelagibius sp. Alg239-R121]